MSLSSALGAAVSGLRAQSAAISAVSENIANSSTTAYKIRTTNFEALIAGGNATRSGFSGGSVAFTNGQNVDGQGIIQATGKAENIAIQNRGFFIVTDNLLGSTNEYKYTRNGAFDTNAAGQLVNSEGYTLLGYRTDAQGNILSPNRNSLTSLVPMDLSLIAGAASGTTFITPRLNLPAEAPIAPAPGSQYQVTFEILDALGVGHEILGTFTKTGINNWQLQLADPVLQGSTPPQVSGRLNNGGNEDLINLVFDGNGALVSTDWLGNGVGVDATIDLNIPFGETAIPIGAYPGQTGAADSTIRLNLGTPGLNDGIGQVSSTNSTGNPDISITDIDRDGARFGVLSGIEVDDDGLVTATFDNGLREIIYRIPLATFPNPEGLTHVGGTVYDENENAGNVRLRLTREGDAGELVAAALENSSTDTSEEFNKMIISQQAYSAASQVVSTTDEMFSTLIQAVQ